MCGVTLRLEGDRVLEVRGDPEDPLSQGHVCPKVLGLKAVHEDPDRLRTPQKRIGDRWESIGWDQAFEEVSARLREVRARHGRKAVAVYQGNPTVHNIGSMLFGQLFVRALRTPHKYSATSLDQLPHMLASLEMFGHQLLLPVPDVDRSDHLLMLGANPLVSNGSLMSGGDIGGRLKALQARGGRLIVVDPRRTETAAIADTHVFVRPGADALLLAALVREVIAAGPRLGRLAAFTDGLDALRAAVDDFTPERVAGATGVPSETLRALARGLLEAERPVVYGRMGVCTQRFGGLAAWLVNALNLVLGRVDAEGGAMFTTPALDAVSAAARLGQAGHFARRRSRVRGLPEFGGELPAATLAEEIDTPGEGQIRALVTSAGNPVLSAPNGRRLDAALPGLELMISIDIYRNETTRHAHYILPPTFGIEHEHYDAAFHLLAVRNTAKYAPAAVARGPDARHDWEIFVELASRLDASPLGRVKGRAQRAALLRMGPGPILDLGLRVGPYGRARDGRPGLTLARLAAAPHGVDLGPLQPVLPGRLFTPEGRIRLAPAVFLADLPRLRECLDEAPAELVLIGRRDLRTNNSWMHNDRRFVKGKPRCTLLMHPDDAAARGLESGGRARLRSRVGSVEVPVELDEALMPGVVSLPHGWGHHREGMALAVASAHAGVSINDVIDERDVDALSGTAALNGQPVEVTRAEA